MSENKPWIVLGGGCFWCLEAVYRRIEGVTGTRPGYAGGHVRNPSYEDVCKGDTGHAEVVEVSWDPKVMTLESILEIFWKAHDPTTKDRQGNDVGTQYRSVIMYADESQKTAAEQSIANLAESGTYDKAPVTQILPLEDFWPAEAYHKDYFEQNGQQSYCRLVIAPKLHKLALLED